jgi:parvulin-like peptidyl-prolyl isomerase
LSLPLDWDTYVKTIVTDAKLRQVWKERKHEFDGSEVRAAHIVLKSDKPEDDVQTLKGLRSQIDSGSLKFADAAQKHSQSRDSAKKGGDLGRFGFRGPQPPPFPQIAFSLKVGEVSEPFRSQFGVHLLTVTKRIDGQLSLEDARPEIFQRLSLEMQQEVLKQERANAKIEKP